MKDGKRDYSYDLEYQKSPAQVANRVKRNAARRTLMAEGVVKKKDGLDVHHKNGLKNGGTNARSNLKAIPRSLNRSKK